MLPLEPRRPPLPPPLEQLDFAARDLDQANKPQAHLAMRDLALPIPRIHERQNSSNVENWDVEGFKEVVVCRGHETVAKVLGQEGRCSRGQC